MIHDGAVDEFMSIPLAVSMPNIGLFSAIVVNADCIGLPALEVTQKFLRRLGSNAWTALSDVRGVNAFPWAYRQYSLMCNLLPLLNTTSNGGSVHPSAARVTEKTISDQVRDAAQLAGEQVKILILCPLTPLAEAVQDPEFRSAVSEIVWMGGAYKPIPGNVPGNVDTGLALGANPNAEWNAYWDPFAVDAVFRSGAPLTMFPLNVTNEAMLGPEWILENLVPESRQYPILDLAAQMYAMVAFEAGYSFWDTVTTAYLGNPGLFTFKELQLTIDVSDDTSKQGTIATSGSGGYPVNVAQTVDVQGFYSYYLSQLKSLSFG